MGKMQIIKTVIAHRNTLSIKLLLFFILRHFHVYRLSVLKDNTHSASLNFTHLIHGTPSET